MVILAFQANSVVSLALDIFSYFSLLFNDNSVFGVQHVLLMKFETRDEGKGKSLRCQTTFANEKFILIAAGMILCFFANKGQKKLHRAKIRGIKQCVLVLLVAKSFKELAPKLFTQ